MEGHAQVPTSRLQAQMTFLLAADGLKNVKRTCIISLGNRVENSAEHSWHVALMAMVLAEHCPEPIEISRVIELLLIHDLVEVYAGDTLIYDDEAIKDQALREQTAAEKLFGMLPRDQRKRIESLWEEFESRSTPEARYAKAIDSIAPTWLHLGEHATPPAEKLTVGMILERKRKILEAYPVLMTMLEEILESAVKRGLILA